MSILKSLTKSLFAIVLLVSGATVSMAEEELCAAFRNSEIDASLIDSMLESAKNGGLYRIQSANSSVGFCADSLVGRIEAEFTAFQGGVSLPKAHKASYGQALVRVDASSLDAHGSVLGRLLKSEGFFDVEHFPEILFVSTNLHWESATRGVLEGRLTLRGVTRPVSFAVQLLGMDGVPVAQAEKVRVKATTTIKPSEFGMQAVQKLAEDAVELCMTVDAIRYSI